MDANPFLSEVVRATLGSIQLTCKSLSYSKIASRNDRVLSLNSLDWSSDSCYRLVADPLLTLPKGRFGGIGAAAVRVFSSSFSLGDWAHAS